MTEIIQCRMCHLQFPGEKCSRGRGFCIATENEVCMTGRIFKSKLWDGGGGSCLGHMSYRKKQGPSFAPGSPGMTDLLTPDIGHNEK